MNNIEDVNALDGRSIVAPATAAKCTQCPSFDSTAVPVQHT
jgi:hypothetical protein